MKKQLLMILAILLSVIAAKAQSFVFQFQGNNVEDGGTVTIPAVPDDFGFGEYWCETNPSSNPANGLILKKITGSQNSGTANLTIEQNTLNPKTIKWCMGGACTLITDNTSLDKTFSFTNDEVQVQFDAENCRSEGELLATLTVTIGSETHSVKILFTYGSADSQQWWGYATDNDFAQVNSIGVGQPNIPFLTGIYVPANHEQIGGGTVKAVRVHVREGLGATMKNVSVWISKKLPSSLNAADYVQAVTSLSDGANDIELTTPYPINDQAFYIGYAVTSSNSYPIMCCGTQDAPNAFLIYYQDWTDLNGKGFGKLAFQLLVEGVTTNDYSATPSAIGTLYELTGEALTIPVKITNNGLKTIKNISYTITTDGNTSDEQTISTPDIPVNNEAAVNIVFPADDKAVKYTKTFSITKVNGELNSAKVNSASGHVICLSSKPQFTLAIEEFTGTWCGWCPFGIAGLKYVHETYGDKAVLIAVHYGDPMAISDYNPISETVESFPSSYVNRMTDMYPHPSYFQTYLPYIADMTVPGSIEVDAEWASDNQREIKIKTSTKFHYADTNAQYGIAFVLVEDGLRGKGSEWAQANNLSHNSNYAAFTEWYNAAQTVTGLAFDHVAVGAWNIQNGVNNSVPEKFEADEELPFTYNADISSKSVIQNKSKLSVVALLIDKSNGVIINAAQTTISAASDIKGVDSATASESVRYTLDGRQMSAPQRGINIVRMSDGTVRKVMVK